MTVILVPLGRAVGAGTREIGAQEQSPPPTLRVAVGARSVGLDAAQTELWRQLHATAPLSLTPLDRAWAQALVAPGAVAHRRAVLEELLDLRVLAEVDLDHADALVAFSEHVRWLVLAPVPPASGDHGASIEQAEVLADSRTTASLKSAVFAASARLRGELARTSPIVLLRAVMLGTGPLLESGQVWFDSALAAPRTVAPEREETADEGASLAPIEIPVGVRIGSAHRYGREERIADADPADPAADPEHPNAAAARPGPAVAEVTGPGLVDFLAGHRFEPLLSYVGPWPDDAGPIRLGGTAAPSILLDATQTDLWRSAPRRDTLLDGAASLGLSGRIDDLAWYLRRIADLVRLGAGYVERARPVPKPDAQPGSDLAPGSDPGPGTEPRAE